MKKKKKRHQGFKTKSKAMQHTEACIHSSLPVTTNLKEMSASSSMWETPFWKIWRAFPGPLNGLIKTSSFLGRGTSQLSISLTKKNIAFKIHTSVKNFIHINEAYYWHQAVQSKIVKYTNNCIIILICTITYQ